MRETPNQLEPSNLPLRLSEFNIKYETGELSFPVISFRQTVNLNFCLKGRLKAVQNAFRIAVKSHLG